jgi:hypothetical protein
VLNSADSAVADHFAMAQAWIGRKRVNLGRERGEMTLAGLIKIQAAQ